MTEDVVIGQSINPRLEGIMNMILKNDYSEFKRPTFKSSTIIYTDPDTSEFLVYNLLIKKVNPISSEDYKKFKSMSHYLTSKNVEFKVLTESEYRDSVGFILPCTFKDNKLLTTIFDKEIIDDMEKYWVDNKLNLLNIALPFFGKNWENGEPKHRILNFSYKLSKPKSFAYCSIYS